MSLGRPFRAGTGINDAGLRLLSMSGPFSGQEFAVVETLRAAVAGSVRFRIKELYRCDSVRTHL
jgi:hypothetical protein